VLTNGSTNLIPLRNSFAGDFSLRKIITKFYGAISGAGSSGFERRIRIRIQKKWFGPASFLMFQQESFAHEHKPRLFLLRLDFRIILAPHHFYTASAREIKTDKTFSSSCTYEV
jgi:hypothetical protein